MLLLLMLMVSMGKMFGRSNDSRFFPASSALVGIGEILN